MGLFSRLFIRLCHIGYFKFSHDKKSTADAELERERLERFSFRSSALKPLFRLIVPNRPAFRTKYDKVRHA